LTESEGIERFIQPHLQGITGYSASTSPDTLKGKIDVPMDKIIKMNANENPYGCSPKVMKALSRANNLNIYPDDGQMELRKIIAGYAGVAPQFVVCGHGSNTLIDFLVRLFVGPGDEVINAVPTFDLYRLSTLIAGGNLVNTSRDDKFNINLDAMLAAITPRTKMIFLATPNNPTGNLTPREQILALIKTGLPVVIDEAYYEFSGETVMPLTHEYKNLIVLRTFSKWAGLAGLRVGYGVFPAAIAAALMATKIPHNVSVAAEIAVRESLDDLPSLQGKIKALIVERSRLFSELQSINYLKAFPSKANFIFCNVLKGSASDLHQQLQKKGVLVRYFETPLLKNSIRISIGKPDQTDTLMKALRQIEP